jgi:DNA-binding MarR family transcriptional regulator
MKKKSLAQQKLDDSGLRTFLSIMYSFGIITRYLDNEIRKYGSRPIRAIVLNTLHSYGGSMTPMALSRELFRAPNSITSLIYTLEKEGLVERRPNRRDARSVEITLTDKGLESANKLMPVMREIGLKTLSVLDEKKIIGLRKNLKQVREYLLKNLDVNSLDSPTD